MAGVLYMHAHERYPDQAAAVGRRPSNRAAGKLTAAAWSTGSGERQRLGGGRGEGGLSRGAGRPRDFDHLVGTSQTLLRARDERCSALKRKSTEGGLTGPRGGEEGVGEGGFTPGKTWLTCTEKLLSLAVRLTAEVAYYPVTSSAEEASTEVKIT
jgi:hypothetical protein